MGSVMHFFLAVGVAGVTLITSSLAWPKFTTQVRPKLLQDVYDVVVRTPWGARSANVLGVSDEAHVEPINFGEIAGTAVLTIRQSIHDRMQTIVVGNTINHLSRQFDHLPEEKKEQLRSIICEPHEP